MSVALSLCLLVVVVGSEFLAIFVLINQMWKRFCCGKIFISVSVVVGKGKGMSLDMLTSVVGVHV